MIDKVTAPADKTVKIPLVYLKKTVDSIFQSSGLSKQDANEAANLLLEADLCGVPSHGISRLATYVDCFSRRVLNPSPKIQTFEMSDATSIVDGDDGLGLLVAQRAMEKTLQNASKTGIAITLVRQSSHFGMASSYVRPAVEQGFAAIVGSNGPPMMVPWNGRKPVLGTNPISGGVPGSSKNPPFIFDMATSVVARGWIKLAAREGEDIPSGWAVDQNGFITTDPIEALAGAVLPFGGAKGYALSAFIDLLSGVMSGASFGSSVGSVTNKENKAVNIGHFFLAINTRFFLSQSEYSTRYDQFATAIKESGSSDLEKVRLPGERSFNSKKKQTTEGIVLSSTTAEEILILANKCGVPFNIPS